MRKGLARVGAKSDRSSNVLENGERNNITSLRYISRKQAAAAPISILPSLPMAFAGTSSRCGVLYRAIAGCRVSRHDATRRGFRPVGRSLLGHCKKPLDKR